MSLCCIVDASVVLKWFVEESGTSEAVALLNRQMPLAAPDLIIPETINAAWKSLTRGFMTAEQYEAVATLFPSLLAEIVPSSTLALRASQMAKELNHAAYDCFYLALAEVRQANLVTADTRLLRRLVGTAYEETVKAL